MRCLKEGLKPCKAHIGYELTRHVAMHAGAAAAVVGVPLACLSCQRCSLLDAVGDPVVIPLVHCSHTCGGTAEWAVSGGG